MQKITFKLKYLFFFMMIIFSLLSLQAGFYLYHTFFGISIALLFVSVLEILRLFSLYSLNRYGIKNKIVSFITYIIVAGVCFTAAVISFNSKIIEKDQKRLQTLNTDVSTDIFLIRQKYSENIEKQISDIKLKLEATEKKNTAWVSKTYQRRIELYIEKINMLISDREKYLNIKPDKEWINQQKAVLGIKNVKGIYNSEYISSIEQSTIDFLKVNHIIFKKLLGLAMAIMIELGIILLSIMAFKENGYKNKIVKKEIISENEFEEPRRKYKIIPKVFNRLG